MDQNQPPYIPPAGPPPVLEQNNFSSPIEPARPARRKKLVILLIIIGGILVIAGATYLGLFLSAAQAASTYGKALSSAIATNHIQKDLNAYETASTVDSTASAGATLGTDTKNLQAQLPKLKNVPLGTKISKHYQSATNLSSQVKSYVSSLGTLSTDVKGLDEIYVINNSIPPASAALDNTVAGNKQFSSDIHTVIGKLSALNVSKDCQPLRTTLISSYTALANDLDAFIATPNSETLATLSTWGSGPDDANNQSNALNDKLNDNGTALINQTKSMLQTAKTVQ